MKILLFVLVMSVFIFVPRTTYAHVLIRDDNTGVGAILHITPDDDPVAGQKAQLFFDIQDKNAVFRVPYSAYQLFVTDENGVQAAIQIQNTDNTLAADYVFPARGAYKLTLTSGNYLKANKVQIDYSLRVSRGVGSDSVSRSTIWPQLGVVASLASVAVLMTIGFNNRKDIWRKSTW
jgi:hypothetical protein